MRIGLEIVEAVEIPNAVVVDVLPALGADREGGGCGREVPFPVVFVENVLSPGGSG